MAQKIIRLLEDDVSGGEATETVSFALDGTSYEIDLNDKNAVKLREALAPYVAAGRRSTGTNARRTKRAAGSGPSPAEVRDWATSQGIDVPARGRIPASVREAFDAAH